MKSSNRGFTLIESLIALTLLSIIAVMVGAGMRLGADVWQRGTASTDELQLRHISNDLLFRQVQGAVPMRMWAGFGADRRSQLAFEGGAERLRFCSRTGFQEGAGFPRWIELAWVAGDVETPGRLVLTERRIIPPDNTPASAVTASADLLIGESLRFEYLDGSTAPRQWVQSWTAERPGLPEAVRVSYSQDGNATTLLIPLDYSQTAREGLWFD